MPSQAAGLAGAAAAVVLYGSFGLPTKTADTGDGIFFQWLMCSGILATGVVAQAVLCFTESGSGAWATTGPACPPLVPLASVGGAMWCAANLLLVPIVDCWGLGMTMMVWGLCELLAGWATARFGLLGVAREAVTSDALNYGGVVLVLASLLVLLRVDTSGSGGGGGAAGDGTAAVAATTDAGAPSSGSSGSADAWGADRERVRDPLLAGGKGAATSGAAVRAAAAAAQPPAEGQLAAAPAAKWTDALSPAQRRAFALGACVVAGALSGSTFTPAQAVVDATGAWVAAGGDGPPPYPGASARLLDHVFAHYVGIWAASTCAFAAYLAVTRGGGSNARGGAAPRQGAARCAAPRCRWPAAISRRHVPPALIVPSLLAGVCWGVAGLAWFVANENLSIVVAFPIVTIGPGLVSLALGRLLYGEVAGRRNACLLATAAALYAGAAGCIVASMPA